MKITERDKLIFLTVYEYRFPTFQQLEQIHFPSTQRAYQRLNILEANNFLKSKEIKGYKVYMLDINGIKCIGAKKYKKKFPNDYFIKHLIEINEFKTSLLLADSPIKLTGFIPDFWGQTIIQDNDHIPDAVFYLENGKSLMFFLEIERSRKNPEKYFKMINFYINYMNPYSGFKEKYKYYDVFRALIVTEKESMIKHIQEKAKILDCPNQYLKYIWLTIKENIRPEKIFSNIWQSLDNDGVNYGIN